MLKRPIGFGLLAASLVLAGRAHGADATATAPGPDEVAGLRADNKQLSDELAAAWKESEKLKADLAAAQDASAKSASQVTDLQQQLAAAPKSTATDTDAGKQLADVQDKLDVSLRSFSVVQDENTGLKASVDKLTSDNAMLGQQLNLSRSSITALQAQAALTSQIEPLRTQVRQAQDEISQLAAENGELRTRLSLQSPGPSSSKPVPMRPAQAAATAPAPEPAPAAPAPKTYVVVEGDTLTKISRKFYGTTSRWEDILNANHDVLKDEKSLSIGSTLKIP